MDSTVPVADICEFIVSIKAQRGQWKAQCILRHQTNNITPVLHPRHIVYLQWVVSQPAECPFVFGSLELRPAAPFLSGLSSDTVNPSQWKWNEFLDDLTVARILLRVFILRHLSWCSLVDIRVWGKDCCNYSRPPDQQNASQLRIRVWLITTDLTSGLWRLWLGV